VWMMLGYGLGALTASDVSRHKAAAGALRDAMRTGQDEAADAVSIGAGATSVFGGGGTLADYLWHDVRRLNVARTLMTHLPSLVAFRWCLVLVSTMMDRCGCALCVTSVTL
jgi:hypothetical protein